MCSPHSPPILFSLISLFPCPSPPLPRLLSFPGDTPSLLTPSVIRGPHPCVPPLIRACLSSSHPPPSLRFCRCQSWGLGWSSLTTRKGTKGQIFKLKRKERLRRPLSRGSSQQLAAGDEMRVDLQRSCLVIVMAAPPVGSGSHRDFLDPVDEEYQKNRNDPPSPFNIFMFGQNNTSILMTVLNLMTNLAVAHLNVALQTPPFPCVSVFWMVLISKIFLICIFIRGKTAFPGFCVSVRPVCVSFLHSLGVTAPMTPPFPGF